MIKRRTFFKLAGIGVAGMALDRSLAAESRSIPSANSGRPRIKSYRTLGKTGLRLSDIGFGAINLFDPNVLRYAFDCGVNHFDTAEVYLNTNSEKYLGEALRDIRGQVIITSKHLLRTPADLNRKALIGRVEASLKRLQTDYLDIAMLHDIDAVSQLDNEEVIAAYTQLKKEGKARAIGFSTHAPAAMLDKAISAGIWEVVLTIYNHMEGPPLEPLLEKARKSGIGLIAMKVFAGGMQGSLKSMVNERVPYSQAAMRWVMGNPNIDALIVTMSTFSHVEEYVAASGSPRQRRDAALLARYRQEAGPRYCRVSCRSCLSACPSRVPVNDILRYAMYYEHYGMERRAVELYREIGIERRPDACAACPAPCRGACPYGIHIPERLDRSRRLLNA